MYERLGGVLCWRQYLTGEEKSKKRRLVCVPQAPQALALKSRKKRFDEPLSKMSYNGLRNDRGRRCTAVWAPRGPIHGGMGDNAVLTALMTTGLHHGVICATPSYARERKDSTRLRNSFLGEILRWKKSIAVGGWDSFRFLVLLANMSLIFGFPGACCGKGKLAYVDRRNR